jgi:ABC-type branched-chain amino acid transport systems, ATPase component
MKLITITVLSALALYGSYRVDELREDARSARQLGQYTLRRALGEGGMGSVYLAEHQFLRRPCAIKLIRSELATDEAARARFEREVQSAATLTLAMRKRLELAKALAMKPKLLFLDEVNAGLNSAEVERATKLIHQLAADGITIVMIEHLMKVVLNVCTRIAVLHNGLLIADGPPRDVIRNPAVVDAYLGQRYAQRNAAGG